MKLRNLIAMFFAIIVIAGSNSVISQDQAPGVENGIRDNWVLLGSKAVDYLIDRDVIELNGSKDYFTSLKFVVKSGELNLHKCTIHYSNGDNQDVEFTDGKGAQSREVDLKGNTRHINKITFWYDSKKESSSKAVIEVWGK